MSDEPEQPAVWGQLGASAIPEHRKAEIKKQAARGDLVLLLFLIPGGLILLAYGLLVMISKESVSKTSILTMLLGLTAIASSAKILLGRR